MPAASLTLVVVVSIPSVNKLFQIACFLCNVQQQGNGVVFPFMQVQHGFQQTGLPGLRLYNRKDHSYIEVLMNLPTTKASHHKEWENQPCLGFLNFFPKSSTENWKSIADNRTQGVVLLCPVVNSILLQGPTAPLEEDWCTFELIICEMLQGPAEIHRQVVQITYIALGYSVKDPPAIIVLESFIRAACDGLSGQEPGKGNLKLLRHKGKKPPDLNTTSQWCLHFWQSSTRYCYVHGAAKSVKSRRPRQMKALVKFKNKGSSPGKQEGIVVRLKAWEPESPDTASGLGRVLN